MRVTGACAIFRGIVGPCRWSKVVEPATAKETVETPQVNIKRPFHRYPGGLHDTSVERINGKVETAVIHPHLVFLTAARALLKARRVSLSHDSISEGHLVICIVVPCNPIIPDARVTAVQLSVSHLKLRINNPPTESDVRKSHIVKNCHSAWQRNVWHPAHDLQSKCAILWVTLGPWPCPVSNHDLPNFSKTSGREVKVFQVREQGLGAPTLIDGVDLQEEPATNNRYEDQSRQPS